jgi:PmbA protein
MERLLSVCDTAVAAASRLGADEAEAFAASGRTVDVELQKNDLQIASTAESDAVGVRVFRNGRMGFASVNTFEDGEIEDAVERALGIASAAPEDEHNGLPDPEPVEILEGLHDPAADDYGVDRAVESALGMLDAARGYDERITVDGGEFHCHSGARAVVSSRGTRLAEPSSRLYCFVMGMARDGETVSSFDFQFDASRRVDGVDCERTARTFAENAVASLGARQGESFVGTVVLSPKAAAEIVAYPITYAVLASTVQRGSSRFEKKLGHSVASPALSVTDDATLTDGFASASFDREGQVPEVLPIIEKGELRNFLYDSYRARREGRSGTGHAGGGAQSVPTVAPTNVVFAAGDQSLNDIIAGIDRGVYVTRFSGNADPVSGDFSGVVKGGRMIRSGRLDEPLTGTMIAGNTFDLLSRVTAVSRERERLFSDVLPYVRLEDVAVTGS